MSLLIAAVGATIAAIIESSVLTRLLIVGVKPDLVLAITLATVIVLGFEHGMVWAFVGGLLLDILLPDRTLGSTTLALLLDSGAAYLLARAADVPGPLLIGLITFVIAFVYQAMLMILLATTTGTAMQPLNAPVFAAIAIIDAVIAVIAAWVAGALEQRFGRADRLTW
jgi:hypothetical protein